jgi:hypothetical protein
LAFGVVNRGFKWGLIGAETPVSCRPFSLMSKPDAAPATGAARCATATLRCAIISLPSCAALRPGRPRVAQHVVVPISSRSQGLIMHVDVVVNIC